MLCQHLWHLLLFIFAGDTTFLVIFSKSVEKRTIIDERTREREQKEKETE